MSYKRINNITGWIVCLIACAVYLLTMEKNGSLWDCGEFASSAFKLQVPHSPGAPFFVLIGRLFMAPFDAAHAATGINAMSALSSGFTILFLFWVITHFAKKLLVKKGEEMDGGKLIGIMAAGVVGALAYTFSDTFWYSAVEGEVYALASCFTAMLFWMMIKWENEVVAEKEAGVKGNFTRADRWIIAIFFLMGLSIGVHLLNLLTIPAIVMIYFYNRYEATPWKTFFAFITAVVITGFTQKALIQWTVKGSGTFDILFVNDFGLPYFSGFIFFFILIAALVWGALKLANINNWNLLKLSMWCFAFIMLGCFVSYSTTLVRSNANVAVDMGDVDNPVNLMSYVSREQYGDWPILFGQDFTAQVEDYKQTDTYVKADGKYLQEGKKVEYIYADADMHLFPRMWDAGNDQGRADYYARFAGIGKIRDKDGRESYERAPTLGENISFFLQYQMNWMYWRYFMWNFAGKQNDVQGAEIGNIRDGNWKTGIGFYDKMRLGDQDKLPDTLKNNKANNKLFMLPFILGVLGIFYQIKHNKKDAIVAGLLFFFTGIAIGLYLNMAGNQPRERDYAFVGSFYAFSIWIGLGVLYVRELLLAVLKNSKTASVAAGIVCLLAVPVLMANQEWDDHDRSQKTMAPDLAKDYLESCDKNAILFTFGDNDTYPLWYAQEVLGTRPDIRIINTSLLGTDWYINQLRYKVNESDAIDVIWTPEQIRGSNRDVAYQASIPGVDPAKPMDLYTMMKDYVGSDDPQRMDTRRGTNAFPTSKVYVPVEDPIAARQNCKLNATDSIVSSMAFEISKGYLQKNDAAILNIIAANKWKRPIYFTSPYGELGFRSYLRMDGMSFRLVPVSSPALNQPWIMDKMMNQFAFGSSGLKGVYFDEENRRHLNSIRQSYAQAGQGFARSNNKEDAKKLLNKCDKAIDETNMPYGLVSRGQQQNQFSFQFALAAYEAGDSLLARKVNKALTKDLDEQMRYYAYLGEMSVDELKKMIVDNSKLKYQQERDNLISSLTNRLAPLYDEAEVAFQLLVNLKQVEESFVKENSSSPNPPENKGVLQTNPGP
jgi:hypothetical protein